MLFQKPQAIHQLAVLSASMKCAGVVVEKLTDSKVEKMHVDSQSIIKQEPAESGTLCADAPKHEPPAEEQNFEKETLNMQIEEVMVKDEPVDLLQEQLQGVPDATPHTFKEELGEVAFNEQSSKNVEAEVKWRQVSSEACSTSPRDLQSDGADLGSNWLDYPWSGDHMQVKAASEASSTSSTATKVSLSRKEEQCQLDYEKVYFSVPLESEEGVSQRPAKKRIRASKKGVPNYTFTEEQHRQIADFVRDHPALYSKRSKDWTNPRLKDGLWRELAATFNDCNSQQVKKFYEAKRTDFGKIEKREKESGPASRDRTSREELIVGIWSFLSGHIAHERTQSNDHCTPPPSCSSNANGREDSSSESSLSTHSIQRRSRKVHRRSDGGSGSRLLTSGEQRQYPKHIQEFANHLCSRLMRVSPANHAILFMKIMALVTAMEEPSEKQSSLVSSQETLAATAVETMMMAAPTPATTFASAGWEPPAIASPSVVTHQYQPCYNQPQTFQQQQQHQFRQALHRSYKPIAPKSQLVSQQQQMVPHEEPMVHQQQPMIHPQQLMVPQQQQMVHQPPMAPLPPPDWAARIFNLESPSPSATATRLKSLSSSVKGLE